MDASLHASLVDENAIATQPDDECVAVIAHHDLEFERADDHRAGLESFHENLDASWNGHQIFQHRIDGRTSGRCGRDQPREILEFGLTGRDAGESLTVEEASIRLEMNGRGHRSLEDSRVESQGPVHG